MDDFWNIIKGHKKLYIITIAVVATILIINSSIDFAEKLKKNTILVFISLCIFYFLARILIKEEIKNVTKK